MTWSQIKWIAIISMTIDHMATILIYHDIALFDGVTLSMVMHFIGRMAFPIFAYGIAQGCVYTSNRKKYLGRLLVFAFISEIPYRLAFNYGVFFIGAYNVFFTLFAGAISCAILHVCRSKRLTGLSIIPIGLIVLIAEIMGTEYGAVGIIGIVFTYILLQNKKMALFALAFIMIFFYTIKDGFSGFSYPQFNWLLPESSVVPYIRNAVGAVIGVLLLLFYNGDKGTSRSKWFFYGYYPIHLLVLYLGRVIA